MGSGESARQEARSFHRVRPVRQELIPETSGVLEHSEKLPDPHEASDRQQGRVGQLPSSTVFLCQTVSFVAGQVDLKDQRQVSACEAQQLADAEGPTSPGFPHESSLQTQDIA